MKKRTLYVGLAIAVAALFCLQAGAVSMTNKSLATSNALNELNKLLPKSEESLALTANVLVSVENPDGDDLHPKVTLNSEGVSVVVYKQQVSMFDTSIPIYYSDDQGVSWEGFYAITSEAGLIDDPAIIYNSVTDELFVTASHPLDEFGAFFGWIPGDILNADGFKNAWSFSTEDPSANAVTTIGQFMVWLNIDDYNEYLDGPHLKYMTYDDDSENFLWPSDVYSGGAHGSYYDGESEMVTSPASNTEMAAGNHLYMVMETETDDGSKISYKSTYADLNPESETFTFQLGGGSGGMDKYADIEVWPFQQYIAESEGNVQVADPDVAASGDNVVVVYMATDTTYGDWDIICKYSSDNGDTWGTSTVGKPIVDSSNPAVFMLGNNVYLVYIEEGNLYLIKSEDGGATWETPEQINEVDGTVVAETSSVDVNSGGIVWTDNRNGVKDIYYQQLPIPIMTISITGGFGVSATIGNIGTADATDMSWSIDLDGLVFIGAHTEGTISSLAAGDSETVKAGFVLGLGKATITVTAGGATKTTEGTVLGPFVIGL